ncbi:hypothetical protein [Rhizobium sp. PAMB 3182]
MMRQRIQAPLLSYEQAEAAIELWRSAKFDTYDIHRLLDVPEASVARTLQAARDIAGPLIEREGVPA